MLSSPAPATRPLMGGVFGSVFSPSNAKPPAQSQRFKQAATFSTPKIRSQLHAHLRALLGIGNEDFVYGSEEPVPGRNGPFQSHFFSCPPLNKVRQPSVVDHAAQSAKDSKSPLWTQLIEWKNSVGAEALNKLLAQVLDDLMTEFITWSYAGVYKNGLHLHLEFWVEHIFCRTVHTVLQSIGGQTPSSSHS